MDIESAFKQFDIRGHYPQIVDERLAYALAKALTKYKKPKRVLVCCDTRESSPSLKEFLVDGFANAGVTVFDLGEAPMPVFNFAMTLSNYDLGIMVTASHVSENENGFKIIGPGPLPLDQKEIADLKNALAEFQNEPIVVPRSQPNKVAAIDAYVENILTLVGTDKPKIKLALDATKSAVLTTVMIIFQKMAADIHFVSNKHTGSPLLEITRQALARDVVTSGSDLGIIWDSDGDRVVFVDRRGQLIPMSFVLGILASAVIKNGPHKKVAADIRSGLVVKDLVTAAGGELIIFPAWNTNIKFAMKEDPEIAFGGETSGHFMFADFFAIDDGILAALRFIREFEAGFVEEKLQELRKKYFELPEKNIPCPAEKSPALLEKLTEHYRRQDYLVSVVDGLTVFGPDWKFNLRQSVTEPYLRLNLEARSASEAQKIYTEINNYLGIP